MLGQSSFSNLESYWKDDFTPLQDAGKDVLAALREDENAPDADLFRRISASDEGSHQYFPANEVSLASSSDTTLNSNGSVLESALSVARTPGSTGSQQQQQQLPTTNGNGYPPNKPKLQPPTLTLRHERSESLPPLMSQELQKVKSASLMGLLPEAGLAWMTVDHKLFIWPSAGGAAATQDGPSFCSFEIPNKQCVLSVGLVRPKKGVFLPSVKWCLVVTTADEAIICALSYANYEGSGAETANAPVLLHRAGAMRLIPTLFSVATDNVRMLSVCGTSSGRIFLGGEDGCLYEMTYEGLWQEAGSDNANGATRTIDQQLDQFYDHGENIPSTIKEDAGGIFNNWAVARGKRVLSSVLSTSEERPRKCRKLNHSGGSSMSAVVPEFLTKVASFISGETSANGGSIVKMVVCEERSCLFTLGRKGYICAFSYLHKGKDIAARQVDVLKTPEVAKRYLNLVSKQNMTSPRADIYFPGGGAAAQKGVGGMDGARKILSQPEHVFTPISLHVVPQNESSRINLIAVTKGGLRYFISAISSTAGQIQLSARSESLATIGKLSLCHIRAPPPLSVDERSQSQEMAIDMEGGNGFDPTLANKASLPRVDASFCYDGDTILAIQTSEKGREQEKIGDHVVAVAPDFVLRKAKKNPADENKAPGGLSETLSLPLGAGSSIESATPLPGGIVSEMKQISDLESNVLKLAWHSKTPTDSELSVGLVPEFVPDQSGSSTSKTESRAIVQRGHASTRSGLSSSALMVAMNVIPSLVLSRPLRRGIQFQKTHPEATQLSKNAAPRYRISIQQGISGFSLSAADVYANKNRSKSQRISPRLNPWLLQPTVAPLNHLTIQHLLPPSMMVAMNAGGLHYFRYCSLLSSFEDAIRSAGENVEMDQRVDSFFKGYGDAEGFAMCAILAIRKKDLLSLAERAALYRMSKSSLTRVVQGSVDYLPESSADPLIPNGYAFRPSSLLRGINKVVARLLRPVWHKPLVVVTEGRKVVLQWNSVERVTPAKVEFLLDDTTLAELLRDIDALTNLLKRWFRDTIDTVPGMAMKQGHMMDVDDDGSQNLPITDAQFQHSANRSHFDGETERIARLTEQRKIHSLFRLVSRSNQLLKLFSLLVRAHNVRGLPEVEWGLLHGITVSQFVLSSDGQERLDKLLNSLVTLSADFTQELSMPSTEADNLARDFAGQCYLFFSQGSYNAYWGLSLSQRALAWPPGSPRRIELAAQAKKHFIEASKHWHSSSLVCGHSLHTKDNKGYKAVVDAAVAGGSPVAKASSVLAQLEEVEAIVDVCFDTASNFAPSFGSRILVENEPRLRGKLAWEADLYHKRIVPQEKLKKASSSGPPTPSSTSRALVLGTNVTADDAIRTCWSLIFYHTIAFLQRHDQQGKAYGLRMVSKASAKHDKRFQQELFQELRNSGHTETLLHINSPEVEEWLKNGDKDSASLYYKYLMFHGRYAQAGNYAVANAKSNEKISLEDRIEWLTMAKGAEECAPGTTWNYPEEQGLNEARDLLDVAQLQLRVLNEMSQSSDRDELSVTLLDATRLFQVAAEECLYSICLLLMSLCKSNDSGTIEDLWRKIFCEAIFPCSTGDDDLYQFLLDYHQVLSDEPLVSRKSSSGGPPLFEEGTWAGRLETKVTSLGVEVFDGGAGLHAFDPRWFLSELESLRRTYSPFAIEGARYLTPAWSLQIVIDVGVPYSMILNAWETSTSRTPLEADDGADQDHFDGIVILLDLWITAAKRDGKFMDELSRAVNTEGLMERIRRWKHELERRNTDTSSLDAAFSSIEDGLSKTLFRRLA